MIFQIDYNERDKLERAYRDMENVKLILFNIQKFNLDINKQKYIDLLKNFEIEFQQNQKEILEKYTKGVSYNYWRFFFSQCKLEVY